MSTLALVFMIASWSFVLGLTAWCFARAMRAHAGRGKEDDLPRKGS